MWYIQLQLADAQSAADNEDPATLPGDQQVTTTDTQQTGAGAGKAAATTGSSGGKKRKSADNSPEPDNVDERKASR